MRIIAALLISTLASCANDVHEPVSSAAIDGQTQGADERLRFQMPTAEPFAFTHFCLRYADDCRVHDASSDEALASSDARWNELAEVNDEVNHSITPHANGTRIGYGALRRPAMIAMISSSPNAMSCWLMVGHRDLCSWQKL